MIKELEDIGAITVYMGPLERLRAVNSVWAFYTLAEKKKSLKFANIEFVPSDVVVYGSVSRKYYLRHVWRPEDYFRISKETIPGTFFVVENELRARIPKDMERLGGWDYWEQFVPSLALLQKLEEVKTGMYDDFVDYWTLEARIMDELKRLSTLHNR